jgi:hypothetical protein
MVVILCHWLCDAFSAKRSVNSNSSIYNHCGILSGGERDVLSDVCGRNSHSKGVSVCVVPAVVPRALSKQIPVDRMRTSLKPEVAGQCRLQCSFPNHHTGELSRH